MRLVQQVICPGKSVQPDETWSPGSHLCVLRSHSCTPREQQGQYVSDRPIPVFVPVREASGANSE